MERGTVLEPTPVGFARLIAHSRCRRVAWWARRYHHHPRVQRWPDLRVSQPIRVPVVPRCAFAYGYTASRFVRTGRRFTRPASLNQSHRRCLKLAACCFCRLRNLVHDKLGQVLRVARPRPTQPSLNPPPGGGPPGRRVAPRRPARAVFGQHVKRQRPVSASFRMWW